MARRFSYPLLPRADRTTTVTSDVLDLTNEPLRQAILHWKVYSGSTGTAPTLNLKVQGAPTNEAALFTAMRAFLGPIRTHTAPAFATFTQLATAGQQLKFTDWVPRYVRAVVTIAGSSPSFNCALWIDGEST